MFPVLQCVHYTIMNLKLRMAEGTYMSCKGVEIHFLYLSPQDRVKNLKYAFFFHRHVFYFCPMEGKTAQFMSHFMPEEKKILQLAGSCLSPDSILAIFGAPCASVSKRVSMKNYFNNVNVFHLQVHFRSNPTHFHERCLASGICQFKHFPQSLISEM